MDADELVRRFGPFVYNLALRLTANAVDAQDLAQDALLRALTHLSGFRGENPAGWVARITANAWKNKLRALSARKALRFFSPDGEGVDAEPASVPSHEPGPEAAAAASDERSRVEAAMAALEPEERAVLVLRELEGQSYQQIAEALEIPLGTVKSRLARAREELARSLSEVRRDA